MKKSFSILIVSTLLLLLSSAYYLKMHFESESAETTLQNSFNNSGAKAINSEIYFWGKIEETCKDIEDLKPLAADFSKAMGILDSKTYSSKTIKNDSIQKIETSGIDAKNRMIAIDVQLNVGSDKIGEKFISVNVTGDLLTVGLDETRKTVVNTFKKYNIKPKVNSCITGIYDGELGSNQLNDIGKRIFTSAEAKKVEGIKDNKMISVSAYSPHINSFIMVNGKKVNLNLAIRYNAYEDKTYIWLATPVITTEY